MSHVYRFVLLLSAGTIIVPAIAADWSPTKPVRMIVGFPPGGATDLVARIIQPKMTAALGKQVVIDNRPGANGVISNEILSRAEADGHTIGFGHIGTLVISPTIQKVPYDQHKDFASIGSVVSLQNLIIVHPTTPAKNLKEFIALAKSKAGQLNYASSGIGSPGHLAAALLESMAGLQMTHIPYKGGGPAITDLLAGHVPAFFAVISTGVPHVQSGKARGIAVTGIKRAEALLAPAKTPPQIIERLNRDLVTALKSPDVIQQFKSNGIDAAPSTPAEFTRFILAEEKKWVPIIKKANIKE